jgi:hypothetical protein
VSDAPIIIVFTFIGLLFFSEVLLQAEKSSKPIIMNGIKIFFFIILIFNFTSAPLMRDDI